MRRVILWSLCCFFLAGCATGSYVAKSSSAPQYKTEAGLMMTMGDDTTDPNAQGFPMVYPTEGVNVKVYRDAEVPLADYKTFKFDHTSKTNPLLEKELFHQLQKVLEACGMTRVEEDPQISISMDFFSGKKEQYTPPNTVTSTEIKNVWNTGFWGWNATGYSSSVPVTSSTTTPGYTTTSYYSNVRLNFLDHAKLVEKGKKLETPPMIWLGEADTERGPADIRNIAPVMFGELVGEFPNQSAKAPTRYLRLFRYGGLGLGFEPNDWRLVRYVEPNSVAAENDIRPGDMLLSINGDRVGTFVGQSLWYISNSNNYRQSDAYYLNVLSNKGDKYVTVVIKKASTGEKISLKMTPNAGDRYIYVNSNGIPL